jgi:hypothetical protein
MGKKNIETMIPKALELVKETFYDEKLGGVESKYFSAIANFGVSVLQSGKHATKLFYEAKSDKRKELPNLVIKLVKMVRSLDDNVDFEALDKDDILDASTALKLAVRTYKKADNQGDNHE